MRLKSSTLWIAASIAVAFAVAACGSSSNSSMPAPAAPPASPASPTTGFFITISGMAFSPLDLHVPPGGTVTVVNQDGIPHSVTSEASPNAFVAGSVAGVSFDTGLFTGTKTFTIPSTAAAGTAVPYFCMNHRNTMATPNGTITIDPSAAATSGPSSGGGTGGGGMGGGGSGY
jgi:plastocyanin